MLALTVGAVAATGLLTQPFCVAAAKPTAKKAAASKTKKPPAKRKVAAAAAQSMGDLAVTLETFPSGASVVRAGKALAGIHAGSSPQQGDTIANGSRKSLDLTISGLARLRLKPGARLDLTRLLSKPTPAGEQTFDVSLKLKSGQALIRHRTLTGQQSFEVDAPGAITAPRGTGYAVQCSGSKAKVVVAEGSVASWLPGYPDNVLIIPPNLMATFDGSVPATPEDITYKERPLVAEIMKMRWPGQPAAVGITPAQPVQGSSWPGVTGAKPRLPGARSTVLPSAIVTQMVVPSDWTKGELTSVSASGDTVTGYYWSNAKVIWHAWKWKPGGKLSVGASVSSDVVHPHHQVGTRTVWDHPATPAVVVAWNNKHGWKAGDLPRNVRGRAWMDIYAESVSNDGSVAIGSYNVPGSEPGPYGQVFLWREGIGFVDLMEALASPNKPWTAHAYGELRMMLSPDGSAIALITDFRRVQVIRSPRAFADMKADRTSEPAADGSSR